MPSEAIMVARRQQRTTSESYATTQTGPCTGRVRPSSTRRISTRTCARIWSIPSVALPRRTPSSHMTSIRTLSKVSVCGFRASIGIILIKSIFFYRRFRQVHRPEDLQQEPEDDAGHRRMERGFVEIFSTGSGRWTEVTVREKLDQIPATESLWWARSRLGVPGVPGWIEAKGSRKLRSTGAGTARGVRSGVVENGTTKVCTQYT